MYLRGVKKYVRQDPKTCDRCYGSLLTSKSKLMKEEKKILECASVQFTTIWRTKLFT